MNKAIVIGTYFGRELWAADCVDSLKGYTRYPVITVNIPWELNVIKWVFDQTLIDEFLFLQDSVVVKDYAWIDHTFNYPGSVSLTIKKPYFMYLGKYTRADLYGMKFPEVRNKREAVTNESKWTSLYTLTTKKYLWDLDDTDVYETRHGRLNKVIENDHIIKYKGTWSPEMISID